MEIDNIGELKKIVFKKVKVLGQIYKKFGHLSLFEYVKIRKIQKIILSKDLMSIIEESLQRLYGKNIAQEIASQIQNIPLVSTIDHHGIFGYPFFLDANLIFSLKENIKYLPVFSTNGISLNNSSWPGCLVLTNPRTGQLARLSFFSDGNKTKVVFGTKKINIQDADRVLQKVNKITFLSAEQKARLYALVDKIFKDGNILEQKNFSDQACIISQQIWHKVFPKAPELIYLPLEDVAGEIIQKFIAGDNTHILHRLFFTTDGWRLLEKHFTEVRGAFGNNKGSFLFWGVTNKAKRIAFKRQEFRIRNNELGIEYSLIAGTIAQALKERKIYPTSLICFLIMLYYGLNCIGGFNQTSWLAEIKDKFIQLLSDPLFLPLDGGGEEGEELSQKIKKAITDNFAETTLVLATANGKIFKPSLLDLYLNNISYEQCLEQSKNITLAQSIESELPEIYKIAVPEAERSEGLMKISLNEIVGASNIKSIFDLTKL